MAIILQIETATQVCSAALSIDGKTIALKEQMTPNIHAGSLTLFIQEIMGLTGLNYNDLNAVAVSKGPGSYTGLRIGISTAKGLCYALDKPLIAIDTLKMMSAGYLEVNPDYIGLVCPMIDARRMEVFTAVFDSNLNLVSPTSAMIIEEHSFEELSDFKIAFIGDGAGKAANMVNAKNTSFHMKNFNSAAHLSKLAEQSFVSGIFEDIAYFEPFYLKDFILSIPKKK